MPSESETGSAIKNRIAREGQITFRDFMEMALYTGPDAYYTSARAKLGRRGDYYTSPELHPSFGALLARQLEEVWAALGKPGSFPIVEMGPGTGALARDVLMHTRQWAPRFFAAIDYVLVERSPDLSARQDAALEEVTSRARRIDSLLDLPEQSITGCFLSNELLDAFPVHRVQVKDGVLRELFVRESQGLFVEATGDPSTPELGRYFQRLGFSLPEGCRGEVNLDALDWARIAAARLRQGVVITMDYGYPAVELYSPRHCDGTLLCFYRHATNSDPYIRVGRQDMTTHVDFTSVARAGEEAGLSTLALTTQREFLLSLGMGRYIDQLDGIGLSFREREANRLSMRELIDPRGLGRIKVLVQQRRLDGFSPTGLRPVDESEAGETGSGARSEAPPLLTINHLDLTAPPDPSALVDAQGMWDELLGEDDE